MEHYSNQGIQLVLKTETSFHKNVEKKLDLEAGQCQK